MLCVAERTRLSGIEKHPWVSKPLQLHVFSVPSIGGLIPRQSKTSVVHRIASQCYVLMYQAIH